MGLPAQAQESLWKVMFVKFSEDLLLPSNSVPIKFEGGNRNS